MGEEGSRDGAFMYRNPPRLDPGLDVPPLPESPGARGAGERTVCVSLGRPLIAGSPEDLDGPGEGGGGGSGDDNSGKAEVSL